MGNREIGETQAKNRDKIGEKHRNKIGKQIGIT